MQLFSRKKIDIALKMLIKKNIVKQLKIKFPDLKAPFCISRRNMCVHMGLEKAIFGYSNFQDITKEINNFFDRIIRN